METLTTKPDAVIGNDPFMSADDLAAYSARMRAAKALKEMEGQDRATKARTELAKQLAEPLDLTPEKLSEITQRLLHKLRIAAEQGQKELLVMRFPNLICTDKGRAINGAEAGWAETLTGRPRQAYEFWRDRLQPAGYGLKAMIVDWPDGMPGDVGFFLTWETKPH
ncbi:conserved hypothetical protein [Methylobacterium sp. 4-46]|uniref:hypothetical protein n=1 Tax=unclassified Methylobacterium TaxID=2615210 RepID=UPI000165CA02|nr:MULTISPECIES: hypothetical protein [Methylobacterium]ACA16068.1 conserved hypothetical protein [Methylobacterium sp. 4-46]WFT81780.1 hypothetical protein QA634_07940 [Methylobacterium nodulans]